ncbi:unnamed protein product [Trichogramma brassicae]|uniref:Uncharacterized protein n=1 Tax=Trichogramma brassicae TaxID=86971 RepID=A0A6H5IHM9_9HYME|nr:unnamed protein product [Trichogramma brassicae]
MSDQQKRMHEAAAKLKIDTTMCDQEGGVVAMNLSLYNDDTTKCSQDNVSKSLKPVHEALQALDQTYATIAQQASNAKKCVDDATLSSSFSVAKCLTKSYFIQPHTTDCYVIRASFETRNAENRETALKTTRE